VVVFFWRIIMWQSVLAGTVICAAASAARAAEHHIHMAGSSYTPATIEARVGDTLVFTNDDGDAHNVFVPTVAFSTDLGKQDPGKVARLVLIQPGTFEVECVFHQHMTVRVNVSH
jgi:plastocyanin